MKEVKPSKKPLAIYYAIVLAVLLLLNLVPVSYTHLDVYKRQNLMAEGTLNHAMPVAMPAAMSVEPTPVEKAPSAP